MIQELAIAHSLLTAIFLILAGFTSEKNFSTFTLFLMIGTIITTPITLVIFAVHTSVQLFGLK